MCVQAAAVLTRTDVHWCETDSHTNEIMRLGLRDDGVHSPDFVRVEINPPKQDFRRPLSEWRFHTDQDIVPDWYEPKSAEAAVRDALPAWVAEHVILPGQYRDVITSGLVVAIYGSVDWIGGSTRVNGIGGSARVDRIGDSARVNGIDGSARVARIGGSARVDWIGGSANVAWIGDSARVDRIGGSARVARIGGSARVDWIGDSANVAWIGDSARVDRIGDSARVDVITGAACTHAYSDAACSAKLEERGHIIDMRGDIPRIIVAAT